MDNRYHATSLEHVAKHFELLALDVHADEPDKIIRERCAGIWHEAARFIRELKVLPRYDAQRFVNALKILRTIDYDEFCAAHSLAGFGSLTNRYWPVFRDNPLGQFLVLPEDVQVALFALIESRQPRD